VQFPTTVEGELVRYVLLIQNGCAREDGTGPLGTEEPCPPPVGALQITLNEDVVFQTADEFSFQRVQVALNPEGGYQNKLIATAKGRPGSVARFTILALRPALVRFAGRSILPWAFLTPATKVYITAHNAGPSPMAFRVVFYNPDGSRAGRSEPRRLPAHATAAIDLANTASRLGLSWTRGAVHVHWVAPGYSRMSSVATETHREPDESGNLEVANIRELALDDWRGIPVSLREYIDIAGSEDGAGD
jgi:hypothetical protein